jgi:hypothetical protein
MVLSSSAFEDQARGGHRTEDGKGKETRGKHQMFVSRGINLILPFRILRFPPCPPCDVPSCLALKHAGTFPNLIRGSAEIRSCNPH